MNVGVVEAYTIPSWANTAFTPPPSSQVKNETKNKKYPSRSAHNDNMTTGNTLKTTATQETLKPAGRGRYFQQFGRAIKKRTNDVRHFRNKKIGDDSLVPRVEIGGTVNH